MPLASTTISIDKNTLDKFFRAYAPGKRSQIIERLIEQDLALQRERLASAASSVETDADFQSVREDSELWELSTATDGLDSI